MDEIMFLEKRIFFSSFHILNNPNYLLTVKFTLRLDNRLLLLADLGFRAENLEDPKNNGEDHMQR